MIEQEKQKVVSLCTMLLVSVPYTIFILNKFSLEQPTGRDELYFWASAVLLVIPIRIIAEILMHIVVAILKVAITRSEDEAIVDERDKLIELKGTRNSSYAMGIGMVIAMLAVVAGGSITTMFVVMLVSGIIGEVLSTLSELYYYRKGV